MNTASITATASNPVISDSISHDDYRPMLESLRANFDRVEGPLFTTDVSGEELWDRYLDDMPAHERQHHNCHACRRFVERYGGLVTIDENGNARAAVITEARGLFEDPFRSVASRVERARVTGVFVSSEAVWGTPSTWDPKRSCSWQHMSVVPPAVMRYRGPILTAGQRAAELGEDYATLCRALAEFKVESIQQALQLAQSETLYRSEKIEGRLKWLLDLHMKRSDLRGLWRENVTWRAVATAPAGFCHVRSSVVGSLLEDIEAGKPFAEVKRAFDLKMDPTKYQRPVAPPSEGNIKQAEAIVEKLGSADALRRRFARLEDLKTIWTPAPPAKPATGGGVFGHLRHPSSAKKPMVAKAPAITWGKFARTVLPTAERIELNVPSHAHFTAFVTTANPDAPPIIQWDREGARNPVSWYTYSGGSPARQWNLVPGLVEVTAASLMPNQWQDGFKHHGEGVLFVLKDCRDTRTANLCLFPEFLKSEYHSIRSTIEAYSRGKGIEDAANASACGLPVRAGSPAHVQLRVYSHGTVTDYLVDRWD